MRKIFVVLALALALPALALAAQPTQPGKSNPKVTYLLKGTVTSFTAATESSDGSLTFTVTGSNYHARALKGASLTVTVKPSTKVTLGPDNALNQNERVLVTVRDFKRTANVVTLLTNNTAFRIVDQGTPSAE